MTGTGFDGPATELLSWPAVSAAAILFRRAVIEHSSSFVSPMFTSVVETDSRPSSIFNAFFPGEGYGRDIASKRQKRDSLNVKTESNEFCQI